MKDIRRDRNMKDIDRKRKSNSNGKKFLIRRNTDSIAFTNEGKGTGVNSSELVTKLQPSQTSVHLEDATIRPL